MGLDFNQRATTKKANVKWMYHALRHPHQSLPQVMKLLKLDDHDNVQNVVCFDFAPSLLSLVTEVDDMVVPTEATTDGIQEEQPCWKLYRG